MAVGQKTILVVDDEPDVVFFLQTVLEEAGFAIRTAGSGEEALQRMKDAPCPDLVTLDLVMPGKSGIRFLYELRKNRAWHSVPVLIVTAHARDDLGRKDFLEIFDGNERASAATWLEKPVDPGELLARVGALLGVPVAAPLVLVDRLRKEVQGMVEAADADTLSLIRDLVRTRDPGSKGGATQR
jgi:DNA-binding response OmpR family regulator